MINVFRRAGCPQPAVRNRKQILYAGGGGAPPPYGIGKS